ncbi:MAG: molybdopterin cofactor-binding domain-containing protein, partial [Caulobacteraceae bacterium]
MKLPQALAAQPKLSWWIGLEDQGHVRVSPGKVEIGQGILTALSQIAAEELEVDPSRIRVHTVRTDESPNEGLTAGSRSIETSGAAVRLAAAEMRALLLSEAARRLGASPGALSLSDGKVLVDGRDSGLDYWRLKSGIDPDAEATGAVPPRAPSLYSAVGQIVPRIDLAERICASPFVHDYAPPGLLHARVIRRPWPGTKLTTIGIESLVPGSVRIVRIDDFLALANEDEFDLAAAAEALSNRLQWSGGTPWISADASPSRLLELPCELRRPDGEDSSPKDGAARAFESAWSRPYLSHASIGLCCAVAHLQAERLTVWSHTQGPFPLRAALARALSMSAEQVVVIHMPGAGSYGHNGADDVAFDAALIARALPGTPIRVQWSRADEIAAAPLAPAMVVRLSADLGEDGRPTRWRSRIWSGPHTQRPGVGPATNLLAAEAMEAFPVGPPADEIPFAGGGGALRNALAGYDIADQDIALNLVRRPPLRTSALRSLGGAMNVLAIEGFLDELAGAANASPLAYRLALTSDRRARKVIEKAAAMGGFANRGPSGEGIGLGMGYARYKNSGAYLCAVAEVEATAEPRVLRLWLACDPGLVINPDGAVNQLEGGAVQAISWTLKEEIRIEGGRIASTDWRAYP